jgi:hypothetical protein
MALHSFSVPVRLVSASSGRKLKYVAFVFLFKGIHCGTVWNYQVWNDMKNAWGHDGTWSASTSIYKRAACLAYQAPPNSTFLSEQISSATKQ